MSLFGTSPDAPPATQPSSLFDDRPAPTSRDTQASLFADENAENVTSPWKLPTPKKSTRTDLVKSILASAEVPELYVDTYDGLLSSDRLGAGVSLTGVRKVLEASDLATNVQAEILDIVLPEGAENADSVANGVGKSQINVLLALIGLAQEEDEVSLDGVDERRHSMDQAIRKRYRPLMDFIRSSCPVTTFTLPRTRAV